MTSLFRKNWEKMPCYWMKLHKKIAKSKWTVHRLHAEAPRAEATPVVPEAPEAPEASEAPVAVEPSAPPARGHGCAGIKDQITFHKQRPLVFEHLFRCQKWQQVSIFVPFCTISLPSTSQASKTYHKQQRFLPFNHLRSQQNMARCQHVRTMKVDAQFFYLHHHHISSTSTKRRL